MVVAVAGFVANSLVSCWGAVMKAGFGEVALQQALGFGQAARAALPGGGDQVWGKFTKGRKGAIG